MEPIQPEQKDRALDKHDNIQPIKKLNKEQLRELFQAVRKMWSRRSKR